MLAWTVMRLFYGFQTAPDDQTVTILNRLRTSSLCNTGHSTCFQELAATSYSFLPAFGDFTMRAGSKFIVWEFQPELAVSVSNLRMSGWKGPMRNPDVQKKLKSRLT